MLHRVRLLPILKPPDSWTSLSDVHSNSGRLTLDITRRNLLLGLTAVSTGTLAATLKPSAGATRLSPSGGKMGSVALDPAITLAMAGRSQLAFGFDKLVEGYAGHSVRLRRSGDGDQADFGFMPATGIFDLAAVLAWAGDSSVTVVRFYDQMAGGKTLEANKPNNISFLRDGAAKRFSTDWSAADGQLTQQMSVGGVGCRVDGGGYFTLVESGISVEAGLELHVLAAPFSRKKAKMTADPVALGATDTPECVFSYGTGPANYFRFILGGGTSPGILRRLGTGGGGTDQSPPGLPIAKKMGQLVLSARLAAGDVSLHAYGRRPVSARTSRGNVAANVAFGNGQLRVGEGFAPGIPGNMLFGAIIVTDGLSDRERTYIQCCLNAVGQQHRLTSVSDLLSKFDELIDFRDVDPAGLVMGRMGKTGIQFNLTRGAPEFDLSHITEQGWIGVRSSSASNLDNTYRAINTYFADVRAGSIMSVCVNENTNINQTFLLRSEKDNADFSLGLGRHHSSPNMYRCAGLKHDVQGWTRHLYPADGSDGGGGRLSQSMCKYQFNLSHGQWTPGNRTTADIISALHGATIPAGTMLDTKTAAKVGWYPPLAEEVYASEADLKFQASSGEMLYHLATFEPGPTYDPRSPEAVRRKYMRTATNKSWLAHPATPIGHRDGSVAIENGTGSIVESGEDFRLQSSVYQGAVNMGTHIFWGFSRDVWTQCDAEEIQVNLYKLIYRGYQAR